MTPVQKATEIAEDLLIGGRSVSEVETTLAELALGAHLSRLEIEALEMKVKAAKELTPPQPSKKWPRFIGLLAILFALTAPLSIVNRLALLVLGIVLLIWPHLGSEEVKSPFD